MLESGGLYNECLDSIKQISETVIEDRFNLEHGSKEWYNSLDMHFNWLLQYRLSPYFCRWGDNMRVLTYTCPYPGKIFLKILHAYRKAWIGSGQPYHWFVR